ncbi:MAG: hypothetical protein JXR70_09365 [Spirochaetales bacterium]|nr:hypothetical protein [Spirochaetales bacterium]
MNEYVLDIEINADGINKILNNHEKVVIVRSFDDESPHAVVCFSLEPFGEKNQITFCPTIYEYASLQQINDFEEVEFSVTSNEVFIGKTYIFKENAFDASIDGIPDKYGLDNQQQTTEILSISAGLVQEIKYSGTLFKTALNIATVPKNQTIFFSPLNKIKIFLATNMKNGLIIPQNILMPNQMNKSSKQNTMSSFIIGKYLEVALDNDTTTIHYNNQTNVFSPGPY